jgi:predicted RNA methylase
MRLQIHSRYDDLEGKTVVDLGSGTVRKLACMPFGPAVAAAHPVSQIQPFQLSHGVSRKACASSKRASVSGHVVRWECAAGRCARGGTRD